MKNSSKDIIALNRKANFNYYVHSSYEAGIVLKGTEVKSIRMHKVNLKDNYCVIQKGEIFVFNMHISMYDHGNIFNEDPLRKRKLLMHKRQISTLYGFVQKKGFSVVILSLYFKKNIIKAEIGLCKGKKLYDKRQDIAKRESDRRIMRNLKQNV